MKGIKTLIKLSQRELDALRRKMGDLQKQKDDMRAAIGNLSRELHTEMESAKEKPELSQFYGGFANRIRLRQEELEKAIVDLDKQMDSLREEIRIAFGELKRYELALEASEKREKDELARKETIELDDIAGVQHQRKDDA